MFIIHQFKPILQFFAQMSMNFTPEQMAQFQAMFFSQMQAQLSSQAPSSFQGSSDSRSSISSQVPSSFTVNPSSPHSHTALSVIPPANGHASNPPSSQPQPGLLSSQVQQDSSSLQFQQGSSTSSQLASIQPQLSALPPITQLYQSSRAQQHGHPAPEISAPPSFNPFIGTGLNLSTSNVNQNRLASSSATIPRSVALPR